MWSHAIIHMSDSLKLNVSLPDKHEKVSDLCIIFLCLKRGHSFYVHTTEEDRALRCVFFKAESSNHQLPPLLPLMQVPGVCLPSQASHQLFCSLTHPPATWQAPRWRWRWGCVPSTPERWGRRASASFRCQETPQVSVKPRRPAAVLLLCGWKHKVCALY